MVVIDHDTGRLMWAAPGRDMATLQRFFDELGAGRSAQLTHVTADGAEFIAKAVTRNCPKANQCADPFHVIKSATEALDEVRRQAWNDARKLVRSTEPQRGCRQAPSRRPTQAGQRTSQGPEGSPIRVMEPEDLTEQQPTKLGWIAATDPRVHRAYQLKEGLRLIFQLPHAEAGPALDRWIGWARRCRIPAFVKPQKSIAAHRAATLASIKHGLSNGRTESRSTPRSDSSPASRSASAHQPPSSP